MDSDDVKRAAKSVRDGLPSVIGDTIGGLPGSCGVVTHRKNGEGFKRPCEKHEPKSGGKDKDSRGSSSRSSDDQCRLA